MKIILGSLGLGLILLATITAAMMPGGTTDEKVPDPDAQKVIDSVAGKIKTSAMASLVQSGANVDSVTFNNAPIELLSYKTQVVAGTNYFAKIRITTFIFHVRIYQHFSGTTELSKLIGPKQGSDQLAYFE